MTDELPANELSAGELAELISFVRATPEKRLLKLLPRLSDRVLLGMYDALAPDVCNCPLEPLPCECGHVTFGIARLWHAGDRVVGDLGGKRKRLCERRPGDRELEQISDWPEVCPVCGDEPDYAPCPHSRGQTYCLPPAVLSVLEDLLSREPPEPMVRTDALTQEERAVALALRHNAGLGLWHADDLIHEDVTSDVNDEFERPVYTLSDWKKRGRPGDIDAAPAKNGDTVVGQLRRRTPGQRPPCITDRVKAA